MPEPDSTAYGADSSADKPPNPWTPHPRAPPWRVHSAACCPRCGSLHYSATFRPWPTRKVSAERSREAFGLKGLALWKLSLNSFASWL